MTTETPVRRGRHLLTLRYFATTDCGPILFMLLFCCVLLWPVIEGRSLYWGDVMLYFEPMQRFAASELKSGRLPLWNPYLFCGQPFLGNPQMGVFYPLTLVAAFLPASAFIGLSAVVHVFLCGLFMYLFLRRLKLGRCSALCGAVAYMGSACLISRLQFPTMVATAAYCPLTLMCIDLCVERLTVKRWLGLAVAVGLLVLASHAQLAYYTVLLAVCYAVMRVRCDSGRRLLEANSEPRTSRPFHTCGALSAALSSAAIVGVAFAAGQVIPMLDLLRTGTRETMSPYTANRFVFDISHIITLISPDAFGHPANADYFGGGNAWEPSLFIGWLPLAAIGYAAIRRREREIVFWLAASGLAIWLSMGIAGGLYWLAFFAVPGLSSFHDPARFLFVATFALCVLTAFGIDAWQGRRQVGFRGSLALVLLTALPLLWFGREWNPTTTQPLNDNPLYAHEAIAGRTYMPVQNAYWSRFITDGYADYGPQSNINAIVNSDTMNVDMLKSVETAAGYEPVPVAGTAEMDGLTRKAFQRDAPTLISFLEMMNVSDVELPDYKAIFAPYLRDLYPVAKPHTSIQDERVTAPVERAWLVRGVKHIEGKTRVEAALAGPDFDPTATAIVSGLPEDAATGLPEQEPPRSSGKWSATVVSRTAISATLTVDAGQAEAFLVYSGTAYPGWKGRLDNAPTTVFCTDEALIGVRVPPGRHQVTLYYSPVSVRIGIYIMAVALLGASALLTFAGFSSAPHRVRSNSR